MFDGFALESTISGRAEIKNRKAAALLAYLALHPERAETRERLAGLFWSDSSEDQARGSLRQCLRQLRRTFTELGFDGFDPARQRVALVADGLETDLVRISTQLRDGIIDPGLLTGTVSPDRILYGYEGLDQAFATWLQVNRRQWQDQFVEQLQVLLRARGREPELRVRAAQVLTRIDPSHEEAQRFLIRTLAEEGNVSAALRQYNELYDLLDRDYDMEPADETQALIAEIKSGSFRPEPEVALSTVPDGGLRPVSGKPAHLPRIEVDRFRRGGPGIDGDYRIEGFRRDIISSLVRFREWVIVDGEYAGDNQAAGRAGAPDYVLDVNYADADAAFRLVVTLKNLRNQEFIWSDRYTLDLGNWLATQQEIVQKIAAALDVYLSADRIGGACETPDDKLDAFDLWLRGQSLLNDWRPETEKQAEELFRRTIERMPGFAPAYSSLANIYNSRHIALPGYRRQKALEQDALSLGRKAVQLDPLDARGQLTLGWSSILAGQFDRGEFHFDLANQLKPADPATLISSAHGLAYCHRWDTAKEGADLAMRLTPAVPPVFWGYLAGIHFLCGDFEGAVAAAEESGDALSIISNGWMTAALAHLGRFDEARAAGRHLLKRIGANWLAQDERDDASMIAWFVHIFPFRSGRDRERLQGGLEIAGLPVRRD
ncbi:BTAD domain-containing putative transcriptional regulator [Oceanibacterium hippocampi]|uniref:BTAD domain-containing putative transcriptional regulator n=1 Tax=Oceanibacterium hippocampi TaxID=745714 RepID=UPI001FEBB60B|nr:BTAD domain-containing putative transcriptional regulator [Oceanibacterium hippocampi]